MLTYKRKTKNLDSVGTRLPILCAEMLALLAIAILCPASAENAEAADTIQYLPSTVNLTMASGVSVNVEPTSDGVFKKMSTSVGIQVTSADAFSVLLRGDPSMTGSTGNNTKINPVSANSTESTFGNNTWGYSWMEGSTASTVYNPVPASDTALVNNQATVNSQADKTYTLGFGTKVDNTIQADMYSGSVTVSVVATPKTIILHNYSVTYDANGGTGNVATQTVQKQEASWSFTAASGASLSRDKYEFLGWNESPVATEAQYKAGDTITLTETSPQKTLYAVWQTAGGFNGLATMQGMTPNACRDAAYGETARLEDIRDGKKYWVTKLADGNCWMTQNLDFDIPAEGLTIATGSKLDWNPGNPTQVTLRNNNSNENTNSWDQGMYIYSTPTAFAACGYSVTGLDVCSPTGNGSAKNFLKVDSADEWVASDDPDFTEMNGSPVNAGDKTYDAHYLVGNYYTFNAATAGTGASVTTNGANAPSDICPAGNGTNWELPTAGAANEASGTSFYQLLNAQGSTIPSGDGRYASITTTVDARNPSGTSATSKTVNVVLTTAPLFFVRGGEAGASYSSNSAEWTAGSGLGRPGFGAYYWSRSSSSSSGWNHMAVALTFDSSRVYPSNGNYRYYGHSLRCLYHPE